MTQYVLIIELDDETPRAGTTRALITERMASILALGVFDGVTITAQTAHQAMGPTTIHVHDGKVRIGPEPHPQASEESRGPSGLTDVSRISHRAGDQGAADC